MAIELFLYYGMYFNNKFNLRFVKNNDKGYGGYSEFPNKLILIMWNLTIEYEIKI